MATDLLISPWGPKAPREAVIEYGVQANRKSETMMQDIFAIFFSALIVDAVAESAWAI